MNAEHGEGRFQAAQLENLHHGGEECYDSHFDEVQGSMALRVEPLAHQLLFRNSTISSWIDSTPWRVPTGLRQMPRHGERSCIERRRSVQRAEDFLRGRLP